MNLLEKTKNKKIHLIPKYLELAISQRNQIKRFIKLRKKMDRILADVDNGNYSRFITPLWGKFNSTIKKEMLPVLPFNFLRKKVFKETMVITKHGPMFKEQINFLESKLNKNLLKELLKENIVGLPMLYNWKNVTSHANVHTLYHWVRFNNNSNLLFEKPKIIEWGGGYGNMARLLFNIFKGNLEYYLIDMPIMTAIQWLYLASILGEDEIEILKTENQKPTKRIRLIPLSSTDLIPQNCDLFISTWALSESSAYAQEYVKNKRWFGAKSILYAYQDKNKKLPDSEITADYLISQNGQIETIPYLSNSRYIFLKYKKYHGIS